MTNLVSVINQSPKHTRQLGFKTSMMKNRSL